mgnify:CR=1 FL=1
MAKPFPFAEFLNTTATIKSEGAVLGAGGGYTKTPATESTFLCSYMPMSSTSTEFGGGGVIEATHYALTDEDITVSNVSIISINSLNHEVVAYDDVTTPFGDYVCVYLKLVNE